ncbi:MAG: ribulose-phosphate 3-epimerase [Nanoarchaeota archaeon]|nr:ribulose-phosphate 3-epimerase [Nanoarchaeota archaeon]MBU1029643.1 ribulose-phosphate 3-epimerase [Nanoarchaeota archaeon]MBU1849187.1 ribulose-phosphate 3-epimerase [Nanoarchaeota archaeon]
MVKVSASVLAEGFSQEAVDAVNSADMLQLDIMDGEFVPHKTIGSKEVAELVTDLPKDVHLMILNPEEYVEEFIEAGADRISFHLEATNCPEAIIGLVHASGIKVGIALSIETPLVDIIPYIRDIDFVNIMPIKPGASGQEFDMAVLDKIKFIKQKFPNLEIEVDGGINHETAFLVVEAGADILVSDTFIFSGDTEERIRLLQNLGRE